MAVSDVLHVYPSIDSIRDPAQGRPRSSSKDGRKKAFHCPFKYCKYSEHCSFMTMKYLRQVSPQLPYHLVCIMYISYFTLDLHYSISTRCIRNYMQKTTNANPIQFPIQSFEYAQQLTIYANLSKEGPSLPGAAAVRKPITALSKAANIIKRIVSRKLSS